MDTVDYRRLVEAFDPEKAMAIAEVIERSTITPPAFEAAMARLESRIEKLEIRLEAKFNSLDSKFDSLDAKFDSLDAKIDSKVDASRAETLKWMAGLAVAQVIAVGGMVAGVSFAIVRLTNP